MLNFVNFIRKKNENFIFILNNDKKSIDILKKNNFLYKIVNLENNSANWELDLIKKYKILYWINDRLDTKIEHTKKIKEQNIKLITFDDLGTGSEYYHLNICGLFFKKNNLKGNKVLKGVNYLILNNEIDTFKRERTKIKHILVTLGGSDTYGVTVKVLKLLKECNIKATIHIGPSFSHIKELNALLTPDYPIINFIPSLIEEFSKYDLAITGGGVTPFEANASGLPCLVIANELFEIQNGEFLEELGSSKFLGYYDKIDKNSLLNLDKLNIRSMSLNGLTNINTNAIDKIYKEIKLL